MRWPIRLCAGQWLMLSGKPAIRTPRPSSTWSGHWPEAGTQGALSCSLCKASSTSPRTSWPGTSILAPAFACCATSSGYRRTIPATCGPSATYDYHALEADTCPTGEGDNNGYWDTGEQVQFRVTVENNGTDALTGVTAQVTPLTVGVDSSGRPELVYMAHIAASEEGQSPITRLPPLPYPDLHLRFDSFVEGLEEELRRTATAAATVEPGNRALLCAVACKTDRNLAEHVAETKELARTAGLEIVDVLVQHRLQPDPKFMVGQHGMMYRCTDFRSRPSRSTAPMAANGRPAPSV